MACAECYWRCSSHSLIRSSVSTHARHEADRGPRRVRIWSAARLTAAVCFCVRSGNGWLFLAVLLVGGGIGTFLALRVQMTSMPQLVALLHSFVGVAAVLVGLCNAVVEPSKKEEMPASEQMIHRIEIFIGIWIGCLTFTGSLVAAGKLEGTLSSAALQLKGRHLINAALVAASIVLAVFFVPMHPGSGLLYLAAMLVLSGILGLHLVWSIGGADMSDTKTKSRE